MQMNADMGGGGQKSRKFCRPLMYMPPQPDWQDLDLGRLAHSDLPEQASLVGSQAAVGSSSGWSSFQDLILLEIASQYDFYRPFCQEQYRDEI